LWGLYNFVESGKKAGEAEFANELAALGKTYAEKADYGSSVPNYILGLNWINALKETGLSYTSTYNKIVNARNSGGLWQDSSGIVQNTAYGIITLLNIDKRANAENAIQFLRDNQQTGGGWLETDSEEYSEVDSEAIMALYYSYNNPAQENTPETNDEDDDNDDEEDDEPKWSSPGKKTTESVKQNEEEELEPIKLNEKTSSSNFLTGAVTGVGDFVRSPAGIIAEIGLAVIAALTILFLHHKHEQRNSNKKKRKKIGNKKR